MSILVSEATTVLVQGITGAEGQRAAQAMRAYGTRVAAGVTPGKGGQKVAGDVPVYDSVQEAIAAHPAINTAFVVVPPTAAADAALEALWHGISLVVILTERIPVADVARVLAFARTKHARVIGPSSVGIISPGKAKVGAIGASDPDGRVFAPGPIGLLSKSGGMTAELARILTSAGIGQSTAICVGGDLLTGTDFLECARLFEDDPETKALVLFGEIGGIAEERLAEVMETGEITKPVVALVAGTFAQHLPEGTMLGHAGAIVSRGRGSAESKRTALARAGAFLVEESEDIVPRVRETLPRS